MYKRIASYLLAMSLLAGLYLMPAAASAGTVRLSETAADNMQYCIFEANEDGGQDGGLLGMRFVDRHGNEIKQSAGVKNGERARRAAVLQTEAYPERYDLREQGFSTTPKHQGTSNFCWAFSAAASAESNVLKRGLPVREEWRTTLANGKTELAFSPMHMALSAFTNDVGIDEDYLPLDKNSGLYGNDWIAATTLASGRGVQLEKATPFSSLEYGMDQAQRDVSYYALKNYGIISMEPDAPESQTNLEKIKLVKSWLMENGACTLSYDQGSRKESSTPDGETVLSCYTSNSQVKATHASAIAGWDDSFNYFSGTDLPPHPGAWLVKDSYGEGKGTDGYLWVSYYDASVKTIANVEMTQASEMDHIYSYTNVLTNTKIQMEKAANVFTARGSEQLASVSIATMDEALSYTFWVYTGVTEGEPETGQLQAEQSGTFRTGGYHTIELDTPIPLDAGERFSIVFRLQQGNAAGYFPIEFSNTAASAYSPVYRSGEGQSYLFDTFGGTEGQWADVRYIMTGEDRFDAGNVMIGAQTQNADQQADKLELEHEVSRAEQTYQSADGMNGSIGVLWEMYRSALAEANALTADNLARQFEVDNAQKNLTAAMNQLDRYAGFTIAYENGEVIVDAPKAVESGANIIVLHHSAKQRLVGVDVLPVVIRQGGQAFPVAGGIVPENGETVKIFLWILPELQPLAESLAIPVYE